MVRRDSHLCAYPSSRDSHDGNTQIIAVRSGKVTCRSRTRLSMLGVEMLINTSTWTARNR